jgi:hypothetical protein
MCGYRPPGPASPCPLRKSNIAERLLKTPEAARVARVTLKPFRQLAEVLQSFFLVMVDENALEQNLVGILENDLFICHADLL